VRHISVIASPLQSAVAPERLGARRKPFPPVDAGRRGSSLAHRIPRAVHAVPPAERGFGGGGGRQKLWGRLRGRFEDESGTPDAAATALADNPDDELARNAVAFRLREVLAADPELQRELELLWRETESARIAVAEARGVAVAGDVRDSTIITGDQVDTGG
jgi:hypothetical protein